MRGRTLQIALLLIASGQFLTATATAASAGAKNEDEDLFRGDLIPHLRIEIPPAGIEVLSEYDFRNRNSVARTNVLATVREGAIVYTNVAIHLKGAMGSFRPIDDKPALTLNFDKYADGQRFHGLQKLHLNNSVQDASYISEQICREMFLAAGIPTPRATHATVELNGRRLGLFVLVEGWNKQFLKRYFNNVKGNLWDGGFAQDITARLEPNSGDAPDDRSPLDALIEATEEPATNRLARIGQLLDLDRFRTFLALEIMMAHWDGYAQNRNNYRVFHNLETGRLIFMPHGLDQMFGVWRTKPDSSITPQVRGIVAKAVLGTPEGRRAHFDRMGLLLTNVFQVRALTNRAIELATKIRPHLTTPRNAVSRNQAAVTSFIDRLVRREQSVREQLALLTTPLRFDANGVAPLTRWEYKRDNGNPSFNRPNVPFDTLQITANGSLSYGSWRALVFLEPGQYRIEGRVKTQDLEFDSTITRGGVALRLSGERRESVMHANVPDWKTISYDFTIAGLEDVELVCELRASGGWAWFDVNSLKLIRKAPAKP